MGRRDGDERAGAISTDAASLAEARAERRADLYLERNRRGSAPAMGGVPRVEGGGGCSGGDVRGGAAAQRYSRVRRGPGAVTYCHARRGVPERGPEISAAAGGAYRRVSVAGTGGWHRAYRHSLRGAGVQSAPLTTR